MKKTLTALLIILMLLTGCASNGNAVEDVSTLKDIIKEQEQKIKELERENIELKLKDAEALEETEVKADADEEGDIGAIKIGDTITTDRMEIIIKGVELTYDVLPDDTSGFYTHYPADSGNVYIHIDTDVKNLQKQNLKCDDIMAVKADYNNGFNYDSRTVPEDASSGFTYANITTIKPLETLGVRFLIECPQEVEETDNPLSLFFKADKQEYKYDVR